MALQYGTVSDRYGSGDPSDASSLWTRHILPACGDCSGRLHDAGGEGLRLKATGERWYGGHSLPFEHFDSAGALLRHSSRR